MKNFKQFVVEILFYFYLKYHEKRTKSRKFLRFLLVDFYVCKFLNFHLCCSFFPNNVQFVAFYSLPLRIHQPDKIHFWDKDQISDDEPAKKHAGSPLVWPFHDHQVDFVFVSVLRLLPEKEDSLLVFAIYNSHSSPSHFFWQIYQNVIATLNRFSLTQGLDIGTCWAISSIFSPPYC